jgi:hypothetical protein
MAATSTPESTTMLRGQAVADSLTVRAFLPAEVDSSENIFQAFERIPRLAERLENVAVVSGLDDYAFTPICSRPGPPEVSLKARQAGFHNLTV